MDNKQQLNYHDRLFPMDQFSVIREDGRRVYLFAVQYGPTSRPDTDYVVYTTKVKLFSKFDVYAACFDRRASQLKIWPVEDEATWQTIKLNLSAVKNAGQLLRTEPGQVIANAKGSKAKDAEKYPGAVLVPAPKRKRKALSEKERAERNRKIFPENRLVLTDDGGFRAGYDVLETVFLEDTGRDYVVYTEGSREDGKRVVYAAAYDIWADFPVLYKLGSEREWDEMERLMEPMGEKIKWANKAL